MSIRRLAALALVTALLARHLACTPPPFCPNGFLPFDGQTGVPLDTAIVVQADYLPDDLPPLDRALVLTRNGAEVEVDYDVDFENGRIVMTPRAPLEPDSDYEVSGIDWDLLRGSGTHWWGPPGRDWSTVGFTTASEPALLGVFGTEQDTLILAFSEPMDIASFAGSIRLSDGSDNAWQEATVVDDFGDGRFVTVAVAAWADAGVGPEYVRAELDVAATSGAELRGKVSPEVWGPFESTDFGRFEGQPYCLHY